MLGQPKYRYGDKVRFISQQEIKVGIVAIVDAHGPCMYKHVAEQYVNLLDNDEAPEELLFIEAEIWRWRPK